MDVFSSRDDRSSSQQHLLAAVLGAISFFFREELAEHLAARRRFAAWAITVNYSLPLLEQCPNL